MNQSEFREVGYFLAKGLFPAEECDDLTNHMMFLRETKHPGDYDGVDPKSGDPLVKYPRMIHMHRWDEVSMQWAIDTRIAKAMTNLLGAEPYMVQTMLYFKPPGARGQALHQDNMYLRAQPGTCIAAWLALDDCDVENGCLQVVPGSQDLPLLCTEKADTSQSFTDVTVPIPPGLKPIPIEMKRGDVLFFNGSIIHGSYPNTSADRFRRSLIGHYITNESKKVSEFYHPVYRMDGSIIELEESERGGLCGVWTEVGGETTVKMVDPLAHDLVARHE